VPLLVRLGVLPELLADFDDVVERDTYHAVAEVDVGDLAGAQLAPSYAGDRDKPHVQRDVMLTGGRAWSITFTTSAGGVAGVFFCVTVGGLAESAGFRPTHSQRSAASNAPDRMLWTMWMVLLAMGLQTCGLHPDSSQSWPYCGRVALTRPLALASPWGSPVTVVVRPCRMCTSPASATAMNMCRTVPGFSPWSLARSGTEGSGSPGANSPVSIAARQQPGGRRRPGGRPRRSGCADCGRPAGR